MSDRSWLGLPAPKPKAFHAPPPRADPLLSEGWARAALSGELDAVSHEPRGSRNHRLYVGARNLGEVVAGGGLDESTVMGALIEACHANGLWEEEPEQCRKTIASGLADGYEKPRYPAERSEGDLSPEQGEVDPEPTRTDWGALWADTGVMEWLCEPLIPAGRLVALYSPPKVGKSLLALELAVAISRGTHMLGAKCRRTPVLYLDYENARLDVKDRLQSMGMEPADLVGVHHESFPRLPPLDTVAGGLALKALADECGAGLVIIDTISRAIAGDENEASTWLALYRCTLLGLKAAGIAVLRLDHTGKDEGKGMRGSSAKVSDVDLIWRLEEIVKGTSYVLECEAHRIRMGETLLNIERRSDPLAHHVEMRSIGEVKEAAVLRALDDAGLSPDAGRERCRAVLNRVGIRMSNAALSALVKARQEAGASE